MSGSFILGAGVTGLAAGYASGLTVFEAAEHPGGICSSYYMLPGTPGRQWQAQAGAYRFEIGGGHWIFGGDAVVLQLIRQLAPVRQYTRRSSVYVPASGLFVPYPLQNHLKYLDPATAATALAEMAQPVPGTVATLKDWLLRHFGPTLCQLFFFPFHDLYTAGLCEHITPQDTYKSPLALAQAIRGALTQAPATGYNVHFIYPEAGLDHLARQLARSCRIEYGKRVVGLDTARREIHFADGSGQGYDRLLATLPLNQLVEIAGLAPSTPADPCTSVLVLNLGAERGPACPDDHWIYVPHSRTGFHRVGFYSNVEPAFAPPAAPGQARVGIYVEKAFPYGEQPDAAAQARYGQAVVQELQDWGWIGAVEALDPTWIDVAYTWSWPGSTWKQQALAALEAGGIYPVGRYGRWIFQGIADSIRDGLFAGAAFR